MITKSCISQSHTKGVLDLTFQDIKEEFDVAGVLPDKLPPLAITLAGFETNTLELTESPTPKARKQTEVIKAVRFGNNEIPSIDIIYNPLSNAIDVTYVLWLDLSFNSIAKLSDAIGKNFPNLSTLHLHVNKLSSFAEVKKLADLTDLRALSLHGNPIEEKKHYRNFCLYVCPQLYKFDMSPVTEKQIKAMRVWEQTFRKVLNKDEEDN